MADGSSTIRQRELGLRLRKLRNDRQMTVEDVAEQLMCSTAKISRLETAARPPILRDVRDLCGLYKVDEAVSADLMELAKEARKQGWWTQYADHNLSPYIGLEQDAAEITAYSMYFVHALAQTEDYAQAIIRAIAPKMTPEIHKQRVELRLRRQELLEGSARPRYRLLLDEAVLLRPIGTPELMAAQLARILELASSGKATVQVIPFDLGAYFVSDMNFTFLEFTESWLSPVVFVEGLGGNQYYERPSDVALYNESMESIRDSALSPRDSVQRLTEAYKAYAADSNLPTDREGNSSTEGK
jgi:transcriptional regulator with XRE-family HTH domain